MNIGKGIAIGILGTAGLAIAAGTGLMIGIAGGILGTKEDIKLLKAKIERGEELTEEEIEKINRYNKTLDSLENLNESMDKNADMLNQLKEERNKEKVEEIKEEE